MFRRNRKRMFSFHSEWLITGGRWLFPNIALSIPVLVYGNAYVKHILLLMNCYLTTYRNFVNRRCVPHFQHGKVVTLTLVLLRYDEGRGNLQELN